MARFEGERLFSDYLDGETGCGGVCLFKVTLEADLGRTHRSLSTTT